MHTRRLFLFVFFLFGGIGGVMLGEDGYTRVYHVRGVMKVIVI